MVDPPLIIDVTQAYAEAEAPTVVGSTLYQDGDRVTSRNGAPEVVSHDG